MILNANIPEKVRGLGIITRFREEPIELSADIEDMFLQVEVHPADRDYQGFL